MANVALVFLTFTTIVAFSYVSAYKTTTATTVVEGNLIRDNVLLRGLVWGGRSDSLPIGEVLLRGLVWGGRSDSLPTGEVLLRELVWGGRSDSLPTGEDNPRGSTQEQCRRQIQRQQLNHCQMHLSQDTSYERKLCMNPRQQHLQQCCDQLKQVEEQCQCEAIQEVARRAQKQQQQGGRKQGGQQQQMDQMLRKAQMLPNQCNLRLQQCPIRIPRVAS